MRQSDLVRVNPNEMSDRRKAMSGMVPISETLEKLLVRQGLRGTTAGTGAPRGKTNASSLEALSVMGLANAILDDDDLAEALEKMTPTETGASFTGRLDVKQRGGNHSAKSYEPSPSPKARPVLRVINGKCEPTRSKAGKALPGVGSHLKLVWSDGHLITRSPSKAKL